MSSKRKYPKSFYDDGLGDILEWIDDEVLVHSERKKQTEEGQSRKRTKKEKKLYGDNEILQVPDKKKPNKIRLDHDFDEDVDDKPDKKLEDRARGLINRLAAQTMPFVTSEFEKLYSTHSRSSVTTIIFKNIESAIVTQHAIAKRKLVAELMLLVTYLDYKVSHSIGASTVHRLIVKFDDLYKNGTSDEDKRLDNITFCLVNLYITGLISANVILEFIKRICSAEDFRAKSVELLLIIIKSIGFQLRKDSPALIRQLILLAQDNCKQLKTNVEANSKVDFMIEALNAVKNNNMSKIGNYGCDIDKDTIESTLKSLIQRTRLSETLSDATYDEILNSANWYLLETRVDEKKTETKECSSNQQQQPLSQVKNSKTEMKICKALGLNKPTERTIFSALLKVSDYIEASNIIIGFGLNYCSDALLVCVHVAIHEKKYNPFYYNLIDNLCKFNRKYKMAAKFTIQDKIRALSGMAQARVDIFKRLCMELIQSDAIPITILKAIEWANVNESTKRFVNHLLASISQLPEGEKRKIMSKVEKRSSFAGAMRAFTNCFMKDCELFE